MVIASEPADRPRFPVALRGEEWDEGEFEDEEELALNMEFVDDNDPPYLAFDSEGHPLRIIVWNLDLLLCQRLPEDTPLVRTLTGYRTVDGDRLVVEQVGPSVSRSLVLAGEVGDKVTAHFPHPWDAGFRHEVVATEPVDLSLDDFNERWMKAATGRRRWP